MHLMIGPDHRTLSSYTCSMGSMTVDEVGQGKRLTLLLARNCVVIYVLCEALYCQAGKFQVRYFARND